MKSAIWGCLIAAALALVSFSQAWCQTTLSGKQHVVTQSIGDAVRTEDCKRDIYLKERASVEPEPQIIAWSDPDDLLSWEVPDIEGVHVVNIPVRNCAFEIPPFVVSSAGAHANYAKNREVIRMRIKPTPEH